MVATFENVTDDDAEFAEDDLEAFAVLVGTPALHPYAREYTQMLTSHSQYPAFTLGLLNSIADLPQEHEIEFPTRTDEEADASPHRPQSDTGTAPTTC